jgi:hypothetical protein
MDEFGIPCIGVQYLLNDTVAIHSNFLVPVGGARGRSTKMPEAAAGSAASTHA